MHTASNHSNATASVGVSSGTSATPALEVLAFKRGLEEYGIDIQKVRELRGYDTVTRIANAPEHIKGVVNLRGIDIHIKFNVSTLDERMLILADIDRLMTTGDMGLISQAVH